MSVFPALAVKADKVTVDSSNSDTTYNPDLYGQFSCKVNVPEGFDETICLVFMDNYGGPQNFLIMPENGYELQDEVICGPYRVSGYVNNDTMLKYKVTQSIDSIEITEDSDTHVELTVTNWTELEDESSDSGLPVNEESAIINDTDDSEPIANDQTESEDINEEDSSSNTADIENTSEQENTDKSESKEKSTLQNLLISLLGTVAFVFFIAGIVFLARKYIEFHS